MTQNAATSTGQPIVIDVNVPTGSWFPAAHFEERAREARADFGRDAVSRQGLQKALAELQFVDQAGGRWRFAGVRWERQDGTRWVAIAPPGMLALLPFRLEALLTEDAQVRGVPDSEPPPPPSRWTRLLALPDEPPAAAAVVPAPAASPLAALTGLRCSACQAESTPGHRFCRACGAAAPCAGCGAALVPGHRFCAKCGAPAAG